MAHGGFVRRRWVQSLGIAAVLVLGAAVPATAIFSVSRSTQTTVATAAVPQPTNVTFTKNWCHPVHSTSFAVSWQPGAPPSTGAVQVTGYIVTAHMSDGTAQEVGRTGAATTSVTVELARDTVDRMAPTVSVTALTATRWTAESARSAVLVC